MIIQSKKLKCKGKEELKGISSRTGKEYTNKQIYFEDLDGTNITIPFVNDIVYNKALNNKEFILKYYLSPDGKINLNDIGE